MTPAELRALGMTSLDDIFLAGFMEDDGTRAWFHSIQRLMYFEIGGNLFGFECIEDTGTFRVRLLNEFSTPPHLDDDQRPSVMSVRELILADTIAENLVTGLRLWGASFEEDCIVCSAWEMRLGNDQVIFVDPTYHFGMRLGGEESRERWLGNWPGAASLPVWETSVDT